MVSSRARRSRPSPRHSPLAPGQPSPRAETEDVFIGRAAELEAVGHAIASGERLITLLGPAGIGKTRLAHHCAAAIQRSRRRPIRRVAFCDLSEARTLDDIGGAVARSLGAPIAVQGSTVESVTQLGEHLASLGAVVLVLDNFEQVVDVGAPTLDRWLAQAPRAQLVVTSRERLRLPGERILELDPLAVPPPAERDLGVIAGSDAVKLFVARASAARPGFRLTGAIAPDVAAIVRKVDGIPLAIELCAARMGVLGPTQLLERLSRSLDVLVRSARGVVGRQATLRAAIDWSWNLLEPWEKDALAQCSVFRGGFSLGAAAEVMRLSEALGGEPSSARVVEAIQALHDKSLLRAYEPSGFPGELRYGLLEGVREYAAEKLAASGQAAAAKDRHARHFLVVGAAWARGADGHGGLAHRQRIALDAENLLAVCERSLACAPVTAEDGRRALEALLALSPVMVQCARGRLEPYVDQLDAALAATAADGESGLTRARALAMRAFADLVRGRFEHAFLGFHDALLLAREVGERSIECLALLSLGLFLAQADLPDDARARFDEARVIVDAMADPGLEGHWLLVVGGALTWWGDAAGAAARYEGATARFHQVGDALREGMALGQLGLARMNLGHYEEARADCERALGLLRQIDERRAEGYVLGVLGRVLQALGQHDEARSALEEALVVHRAVGDRWSEGFHVGLLGNLDFERGQLEGARRHYERAVSLFDALTSAPRADGEPGSRSVHRRYAGLYLVRLSAVLAVSGQLEDAARRLEHAELVLAGIQKDVAVAALTLHRAHLDLALAARATEGGDREGAARHLWTVRSAIREVEQGESGRSSLCRSEEVRFTLRVLRREMDVLAGMVAPRDAGPAAGAPDAFVVGMDARWFQRAGGERVHLLKNRAARLILRRLAMHRLHSPGEALALGKLFEAGWPGERISEGAANNRVYVTLTKLRKLGLYGLLQSRDDGFLLDPAANVLMEASTENEAGASSDLLIAN